MKKSILSFAVLLMVTNLLAQSITDRATIEIEPHQLNQAELISNNNNPVFKASAMAEIPISNVEPFLSYFLKIHVAEWNSNSKFQVLFHDGSRQLAPATIELDPHFNDEPNGIFTSQLYFAEPGVKKIRLQYVGNYEIQKIEVHLFNPGKTESMPEPVTSSPEFRSACPCPQPPFFDRNGWCPDGNCPIDATPEWTTVTHLIIHHSATSNTSSDWPAVVRSIWNSHVNGNGWDDIGYNWLIDPEGNLYQGRFDNQQGAHFCSKNQGTMGVCMIGTYTSELPTVAALNALEELLAWKSCDVQIDPLGSGWHWISDEDLMHISGHRDGCSTACPGDTFYPTLFTVREGVHQLLENECGGFVINAPTNLYGDVVPPSFVELIWTDNADNETGYEVERSEEYNNNFELIATLPANSNYYQDPEIVDFAVDYIYRVRAIAGDSSSAYSNEFIVIPPLATSDFLTPSQVTIFPNPTSSQITVSLSEIETAIWNASIYDVFGKQVLFQKNITSNSKDFDLSTLVSGIYLLKISSKGAVVSRRVVKE